MSDFILPDIGEGIVECEVVKWLVAEGDEIEEDQPVAEVMTDKALVEIPAPYKGRVTKFYYQEGEIAKVHAPLFALVEDGAEGAGEGAANEGASGQGGPAPATEPSAAADSGAPREAAAAGSATTGAATDFILPDIGEGIVECEIVEWRIAEGDEIAEDQPVVDVMTDKAMVEITAPEAGRVSRLYCAKGENAQVHAPLFAYVPEGQAASAGETAQAKPSEAPAPAASRQAEAPAARGRGPGGRIPASPAVRRLVRELGVSLEEIPGSGKDGRVLKEDILAWQQAGETGQQRQEAAPTSRQAPASGEARIEPIKGVRAVMAKRMVESASTIPHFAYGDEIDVTELLALRERLKPQAEAHGVRLTLMPFFMKAMALAIKEFPILNSRVNDQVNEIHYLPSCNIGMAVDSKAGLMVPNVKGVERLTILEIAAEVVRLTGDARDGRVAQKDLKDGTISISNIGALGGTYATPIINAPEVAIVAIGKTQRLPRFDDAGGVVSRAIMTATWSGDHRIIDGGTIARFGNLWKSYLEEPQSMLLQLG